MIGRIRATLIAAAVALLELGSSTHWARADIIFDQDASPPVQAIFSGVRPVGPTQVAADFHLDVAATTITDIHWWGAYSFGNNPTGSDNFTVQIFGDNSGLPASDPIFELVVGDGGREASGASIIGFTEYAYSVDIPALVLEANTTYWLSIFNDYTQDSDDAWHWSFGEGGDMAYRGLITQPWVLLSPLGTLSFQLTNDGLVEVPEPATLALFGAGLVGLGVIGRKRKTA